MSAIETFKFGANYLLRPVTDSDFYLAYRWTESDPDHRGKVEAQFWTEQRLGRDSYLLEEGDAPLFFFKLHWWYKMPDEPQMKPVLPETLPMIVSLPWNGMERVVEIHIQFKPEESDPQCKTAQALTEGVRWLERALAPAGVRRMFFDSRSAGLIEFCTKRLGFTVQHQLEGLEGDSRMVKLLKEVADVRIDGRGESDSAGADDGLPGCAAAHG
jgi:hypothetical protein